MASLTFPLSNRPLLIVSTGQINNISQKLKDDRIFALISRHLSAMDCGSLGLVCRDLYNRAEAFLWYPLAIQMKLERQPQGFKQAIQIMKQGVLTYLIRSSIENIESSLNLINPGPISYDQWESFIEMALELSQARFNQVFSSKIDNTYLFHSLIHPDNTDILELIFTNFSEDRLSFLFNQTTDHSGKTFLHLACNYNNGDFITFILTQIPKKQLDGCLGALTKDGLSPLLFSVAHNLNSSVYQIVKYCKENQKLGLLLSQRMGDKSINFIQYLSVYGESKFVKDLLLFPLDIGDRLIVLTAENNQPLCLAAIHNRFDILDAILDLILPKHQVFLDGFREIFEYIKNISDQPEALPLFMEVKKRLDKVVCYALEDELCYKLTVQSGLPALIVKEPSPLTSYIISNYGSLFSKAP